MAGVLDCRVTGVYAGNCRLFHRLPTSRNSRGKLVLKPSGHITLSETDLKQPFFGQNTVDMSITLQGDGPKMKKR